MNRTSEEFTPIWAAGFMTGTSVDAVDAAMILTDGETVFDFGPTTEVPYGQDDRDIVFAAIEAARQWNWQGEEPHKAFAAAERVAVRLHGVAMQRLLSMAPETPSLLAGVHGQTVLHRRPQKGVLGRTRQIIDASGMANVLGRPIIYDFRAHDVATGGEGAPLAPAYHAALLERLGDRGAIILNLGGVANLTGCAPNGDLIAFDTGPANGPVDEWVFGHGKGRFDRDGAAAAAGQAHEGLLADWLDHPYFDTPAPKSLDRYDFNASMARGLSFEDGAATLTTFSARAVARGIEALPAPPTAVIACGGGRHNPTLMAALTAALPYPVKTAEDVGWRGDSIEAEAFALLAVRHLRGLPISWPGTTGVAKAETGGRLALPKGAPKDHLARLGQGR